MKKFLAFALISVLMIACGQEEEESHGNELENLGPIDVEVTMDSEGDPGEWTLEALVTQGENPVNDADEVTFEVWKQGEKENSEMLDYEDVNEGMYTASYTFEEDGHYFVIPHVTAHGMHVMPTHELTIGEPESTESEEADDHEHGHDDHDHSDGHSHHSDIVDVESNFEDLDRDTPIEVTITEDGETLEDARVRLEIWQHGDEMRTWIDAEDEGEGVYKAAHDFEEAGDYHVVIHIENDEIHEHLDDSFTIE
ncbi:FixH family protein [Bacillus sp. H-16]|uniref:FixH family protein n=1 Tax=Alteribacter salitolerans TaxID=2912333 RepID=UPI00196682F6|nr:FixH family protein [Alteribacter salitolerans]MBM7097453.1 FixH family protein [Alteribacter salitolerans]